MWMEFVATGLLAVGVVTIGLQNGGVNGRDGLERRAFCIHAFPTPRGRK